MSKEIIVVGSINLDLVFTSPSLPGPGETVAGADLAAHPGGKGANQAVAAARMGASVAMVGCLGEDDHGRFLRAQLEEEGICTNHVFSVPGPSGCAGIFVDKKGENQIVVASGANSYLSPDYVAAVGDISNAKVLLVQLEIPDDAVLAAVRLAKEGGVTVILDPAPARNLAQELLEMIDFLTPNAKEASMLTGVDVHCWKTAALAARQLRAAGVAHVLVTMGKFGAFFSSPQGEVRISAPQVEAVDSTAAGDAFNGALAVALARGVEPDLAADIAAAAGALAASAPGAQPSLPTLKQLAEVVSLPW